MNMVSSNSRYFCLTSIDLEGQTVDLGDGITLTPAYNHIMAHSMLAIARPEGRAPHPGPWLTTGGGYAFDSNTMLCIPNSYVREQSSPLEVALHIVKLIRLRFDPRVRLIMMTNVHPHLISRQSAPTTQTMMVEVEPWYLNFELTEKIDAVHEISWVKQHWESSLALAEGNARFRLGLAAYASIPIIPSQALSLVSIWGALEALFSNQPSELRFRISAMIASFLEAPGPARAARAKRIKKLYDARSAAAHGGEKHTHEDLLASGDLIHLVLVKMIEENSVPTPEELERRLFGQ